MEPIIKDRKDMVFKYPLEIKNPYTLLKTMSFLSLERNSKGFMCKCNFPFALISKSPLFNTQDKKGYSSFVTLQDNRPFILLNSLSKPVFSNLFVNVHSRFTWGDFRRFNHAT